MNANELADVMEKYSTAGFMTPLAEEFKQTAAMLRKQAEEIEYWKSAFERAMILYDQVKHLEVQVYGGTTK
jgi:hypothetical protein